MAQLPENPDCPLSGTKYCCELNMHSCDRCTLRDSEDMDGVRESIDVYHSLLPSGGVAQLFTSRECQFCRGEHKGQRAGYALLDMAHPEPKRVQKWLLGKRRLEFGTMIPLQFSICRDCRRTFLLMDYLPAAATVLFGAAGLVLLGSGTLAETLADWFPIAPFLLWIAVVGAGCLLGRLLAVIVRKKADARMITDVLTHPVVQEMLARGWKPIAKQSRTKLLFSKTRINRGLGTALSPEQGEQGGEKSREIGQNPENG